MNRRVWMSGCLLLSLLVSQWMLAQKPSVGIFDDQTDIGKIDHKGDAKFDSKSGVYTVTGSGENIWASPDAFHFVWKKVSGDYALTADVVAAESKGNPHRKAVLMVRQSLDADSVYGDIALHGVGLTSLQFRDEKGGATREVQSNID